MKGPDRGMPEAGQERPGEGPLQRADRNMIELLQELRVAQTGVQILFAFLLSLSFTDRFTRLDEMQRWTYIVTLLLSVITAGLLVAPAAAHRMTFRRGVKQQTVQLGHKLFTAGLATLALTLTGSVLLVLDVATTDEIAVPVASAVGVILLGLWFVLPLRLLRRPRNGGTVASGRPDEERTPART
ncbi:DUF6328 family protein [Pseudonocardia sp. CA-142604]|uniref:DUF6328 family protein n=1 Tax=Pseudonocardia sp. CA-142604 TaxID=3240024 RepID=UPI003D919D91